MIRRILPLALVALLAALPGTSARLFQAGGASGGVTPVITFNAPSSGYIYPAAGGTLLTTVTATVSPGSFLPGGGNFTSSNCAASNMTVASGGAVTVTTSNLSSSQSCLITAHYPGATPVTQTFTLTGTQQQIASITPCSLAGGCSYGFTVPATSLTLDVVPAVTMTGGIGFSAGGGTITLGTGLQCGNFAISGSNLQITASTAGIYDCTYNIVDHNAANSPQTPTISANGTVAGSVGSISFVNNGSGTSPGPSGTTPVHFLKTFAPGDVPTGEIAVPSVGGVAIPYGADCAVDGVNPLRSDGCPSWPDGSLKAVPISAYPPALAAGGTEEIAFNTQSGAYSTSSTIRPSDVIAASDYNVVLTNVSSAWAPQYYGLWPNGVQIGCQVAAGAVTSCALRVSPPSIAAAGAEACNVNPATITPGGSGAITAKIDNGSGSPGNILTVTAGTLQGAGGWLRAEILSDNTAALAANTVIISQISGTPVGPGTYNVSGSPQLVASESMGFVGCSGRINNAVNGYTGGGQPAIFTTTLGSNGLPAAVNVVSGGSGYATIGSGTFKFDVNAVLALYGSIDPPTCAAELGAGSTTAGTYSAGAVTWGGTITGHLAKGQIITDSLGATAVVTGSTSPFTVSAALTSGAMTANTPACVWADSSYGGQPLKKSYWVFGPYIDTGTGLPDTQLIGSAQVDIWSSGGSVYSVRAIIRTDREGWQPGNHWQSYTYNADIKNGTAEVRGNAQGQGIYTNLTDEVPGAWWTADPALSGPLGASARPDWLGATNNGFSESDNLAINALSLYLSPSDITYWRGSRAMLPLVSSLTPTPSIIPVSTTGGPWDNPTAFQGNYMPFGPMFLDTQAAFGSGGDHFFLTPNGTHLSFWIDLTDKASDHGVSWLNQMRVSGLGLSSDVSGWAETDTGHAVNIDPNFSNAAFTDPVRLNSLVGTAQGGGMFVATPSGTQMAVGGQVNPHGDISESDHWPSGSLLGAYLVDGEYYQLKEMDLMAGQATGSELDSGHRTLSYNGNSYYGITWDTSSSRAWGWGLQLITQFVNFAPPQEPDAQYWAWVKGQNYASYAGFFSYTGSFTYGLGSTSGSKAFNWSVNGGGCQSAVPVKLAGPGIPPYSVGETTWMCNYALQVELLDWAWAGGPSNNANLDTIITQGVDHYMVKNGSQNSCPYNAVNYTQVTGNTGTSAPGTSYDNTDIPSSPPGSLGNGYSGAATQLTSTASSSTLTFATSGNNGPNPPLSGSILNPTRWYTLNEAAGNPLPPAPLSVGTWYTWCETSAGPPVTGTINPYGTSCASPAPLTMATGVSFAAGWIPNQSCPASGDWAFSFDFPSDTGYSATYWAVFNWRAAVGGSTSDTNTAISNFTTTGITNPSVWTQQPRWNACSSFTC